MNGEQLVSTTMESQLTPIKEEKIRCYKPDMLRVRQLIDPDFERVYGVQIDAAEEPDIAHFEQLLNQSLSSDLEGEAAEELDEEFGEDIEAESGEELEVELGEELEAECVEDQQMEWGEVQEQVSDLESEHALDIAQEQDFSEVEYESEQEVIFEPELELMQEQDFEVKLVPLTAKSRKRRNSETLTHNKRQKLWQQDNDDEQDNEQTSLEAVGATTEMECDLDSDSESELKLFDCETLMEAAKEWDNWHDFLIEKMHCQQLLKSLTSQKRYRINWPFNNADGWSEEMYKIDWKILGSQLDSNQYESFDAFVCAISLMFQRAQVHFRNNESLIDAVRNLNHVLQKSLNKYRQSIMKMKIQLKCMSIIRANVFKSALLQEE